MITRGYLAPDIILRLLVNRDGRNDSVIMLERAEKKEVELLTSVFSLFEAVGSIEESDDLDLSMLKRILKTVHISSEMEEDVEAVGRGYDSFGEKRKAKLRKVAFTSEAER